MGLDEAFCHSWYQSKAVVMADIRDWGGGGDDPEESTQRMIERIWESLTDIRMRMDRQAPVPPVIGEAVPVAPIPPPPGVEVPFVAPVPPSPPVIAAEEPVLKKQSNEQLLWKEQFRLVKWASQVREVSGYPSSQRVKEEDGEVVSKFSRVVVSQRWRNRNKVPPAAYPSTRL
ncbi:hypothetical protein Taro_055823 [Colocasia esculenta]|uniref:Uncharacterized protein n=1 Tax=Colocasia esculenta TaxID=4460 RepID=A0A843XU12_COLES|nr:hypothetical protein [Colocasia esculenta]